MKVLACGDREWESYAKIEDVLKLLPANTTLITGGCRGADVIAESIARRLDNIGSVAIFDANWDTHGRAAGPIRNQKMLEELDQEDLVLAFHSDLQNSKGTKDMVNRARKKGIKVIVIT